jgi:class 3 adenylate cyclase/soluble P-type ATPase
LTSERDRFSILIREKTKDKATLLVRGTHESMRRIINFDEDEQHYKWAIDYNEKAGLKSTVFASKEIPIKDAEKFMKEYNLAKSTIDKESKYLALAKLMETDLKFEGIVGFKNSLKHDAEPALTMLREMGVNVHIVSGDNLEHNMMVVQQLKLINEKDKLITYSFSDVETGKSQIKRALDTIHANLSSVPKNEDSPLHTPKVNRARTMRASSSANTKNLALVLSGECIDVMLTNRYLYEHAKFSFEFAKIIIGHDMTGDQKAKLVEIFQSLDKKVLAVGDGFNDINMVHQANVGFQIIDPKTKRTGYQFGDILVDNLVSIVLAMKREARNWNNNLHLTTLNIFSYSLVLALVNLFYQIYCAASGGSILTSFFICYSMFFMIPMGLAFTFIDEKYSFALRDAIPGIYSEKNYLAQLVDIRVMLFHRLPQSLVEALVIFIIPLHALYHNLTPSGHLETTATLTLIVHTLAFASFTFKMVLVSEHRRILLTIIYAAIWGIYLIAVYFSLEVFVMENLFRAAIPALFNSPNAIILIIGLALFLAFWDSFYWMIVSHEKYYPIYNLLTKSIKNEDNVVLRELTTKNRIEFLHKFKLTDSFTTTYKKSFSSNSQVNTVISSLLVPDKKETEQEKVDWFLNLKSALLSKNFNIYLLFRFLPILKLVAAVSSFSLFLYLLLNYLIDPLVQYVTAWVYVFIFILVSGLYCLTFVATWSRMSQTYTWMYHYVLVVTSVIFVICTRGTYSLLGTLVLSFLCINFTATFGHYLIMVAISFIGFALNFAANINSINAYIWGSLPEEDLVYPLLSITFLFVSIGISFILQRRKSEKLIKEEFLTNANLDSNSALAKDLLGLLLPKFILDRMQNFFEISGMHQLIDDGEERIAILFCDIADFEEVVRKQEHHIVQLLDKIFRKFDDLCVAHGIQKIETVGKTYMAASGLKAVEACLSHELATVNPTLRLLNLAKEMMNHIKEYENLKLKIGLHVGKPVMGVIGYHKPQFSLIGDVVNTTSRHCTTGKKGRIMMSKEAWAQVESLNPKSGGYLIEIIPTEMKGKGSVPVYHIYQSSNKFLVTLERIASTPPEQYTEPLAKRVHEALNKFFQKKLAVKLSQTRGIAKFLQIVAQAKSASIEAFKKITTNMVSPKTTIKKTAEVSDNLMPMKTVDSNRFQRLPSDMISPSHTFLAVEEIEIGEDDQETEKLNPSFSLKFKPSQYDLVQKYKTNLKKHNHASLRYFFIIMCLEYILQIILHGIFGNKILKGDLNLSVAGNYYVSLPNEDRHRPAGPLSRVLHGHRNHPYLLLQGPWHQGLLDLHRHHSDLPGHQLDPHGRHVQDVLQRDHRPELCLGLPREHAVGVSCPLTLVS